MAFRRQGRKMNDASAVRSYIRDRIPSASLTLYRGKASSASDGSSVWGKLPVRGDTAPRHEPGTGRDQSRNTPLGG